MSTPLGQVWIVTGTTGEYSDRCEWNVCAFHTEEEARRWSELAQAEADRMDEIRGDSCSTPREENKYDPRMSMDYNGTKYHYEMVEIRSLA